MATRFHGHTMHGPNPCKAWRFGDTALESSQSFSKRSQRLPNRVLLKACRPKAGAVTAQRAQISR